MGDAVTLALIAIIAAVIPALFRLFQTLTVALNKLAESNARTVEEAVKSRRVQERGFEEAKIRNGHLGEQNIQIAEIAAKGNVLTKEVLDRLDDSATTLARNDDGVAEAVKTVKVDLAEHKGGE